MKQKTDRKKQGLDFDSFMIGIVATLIVWPFGLVIYRMGAQPTFIRWGAIVACVLFSFVAFAFVFRNFIFRPRN